MPSNRDPSWRLRGFARTMRHVSTDAEKRVWSRLRDRKLAGFKFRRQVPIEGFVADFYCIENSVVIELDGGQHLDADALEYDHHRNKAFARLGIRVLRFSNVDVLRDTNIVMNEILRVLEEPSPRPSPGLPGEGEE